MKFNINLTHEVNLSHRINWSGAEQQTPPVAKPSTLVVSPDEISNDPQVELSSLRNLVGGLVMERLREGGNATSEVLKALKLENKDIGLMCRIINLYNLMFERPDFGVPIFRTLLDLVQRDENTDLIICLAHSLFLLGRDGEALEELRGILADHPEHPAALQIWHQIRARQASIAEAGLDTTPVKAVETEAPVNNLASAPLKAARRPKKRPVKKATVSGFQAKALAKCRAEARARSKKAGN